jgi:hypothetical protein
MFINEKLPFEINTPIFHHSIIPSGRRELRPWKNSFNLNELQKFRDVQLSGATAGSSQTGIGPITLRHKWPPEEMIELNRPLFFSACSTRFSILCECQPTVSC